MENTYWRAAVTKLLSALRYLADRCDGANHLDGAGFSAFDVIDGHYLARRPEASWSEGDVDRAWQILPKYRKQLTGGGFDLMEIPRGAPAPDTSTVNTSADRPLAPPSAQPFQREKPPVVAQPRRISFLNPNQFFVEFPFEQGPVDILRTANQLARFATPPTVPARGWIVDIDAGAKTQLDALIQAFKFEAADPVKDRIYQLQFEKPKSSRRVALVEHEGKRYLAFTSERNDKIIDRIKLIPGKAWSPDYAQFQWTIPFIAPVAGLAKRVIEDFKFDIAANVLAELEALVAGYAEQAIIDEAQRSVREKREAELFLLSRAEDAPEIIVPGLGGDLFPFQRAGVKYILETKRTFLADEMGCGKSIEFLAAIQAANAFPSLLICPATLKRNWAKEAAKWIPDKLVRIISGTKNARYSGDLLIVNYDILSMRYDKEGKKKIGGHLDELKKIPFKSVGLDESHYVKGYKTDRSKACLEVARGREYVVLMTGTPIANKTADLIHPLKIMDRLNEFGGVRGFNQQYGDGAGKDALLDLHQALRSRCFIRRIKSDVLKQLPPKRYTYVEIELNNWAEYKRAEDDLVNYLTEKAISARDFLASIANLSEDEQEEKISDRAADTEAKVDSAKQLLLINACRQLAGIGKVKGIKDWISDFLENDQKLLTFAHHRDIQSEYIDAFPKCAKIVGGMNPVTLEAEKERFQKKQDCRLIVISIMAGGVGHTLTASSNVSFAEFAWRAIDVDQAIDRTHRPGQTADSVNVWYLVGVGPNGEKTIDQRMMNRIDEKRAIAEASLDGSGDLIKGQNIIGDLIADYTGIQEVKRLKYEDPK